MKLKPHFYLAAGLLALAAVAAPMLLRAQAGTIKVGVLHSLSGTMAISETTLRQRSTTGRRGVRLCRCAFQV